LTVNNCYSTCDICAHLCSLHCSINASFSVKHPHIWLLKEQ